MAVAVEWISISTMVLSHLEDIPQRKTHGYQISNQAKKRWFYDLFVPPPNYQLRSPWVTEDYRILIGWNGSK